MPSDEEIAQYEAAHSEPNIQLVERDIWYRNWVYYPDDCDWYDRYDGNCTHPEGWHIIPVRIHTGPQGGYVMQIKRRRPDGGPGEDWSPMTDEERKRVFDEMLTDHIAELRRNPDIKE